MAGIETRAMKPRPVALATVKDDASCILTNAGQICGGSAWRRRKKKKEEKEDEEEAVVSNRVCAITASICRWTGT